MRFHRGGLGRANRVVNAAHVVGHVADEEGARHVGPIAVDGAAEVEEQDVAALDRRGGGLAVGHRGARAREGDRRERQPIGTPGPEERLELPGDLVLGHARLDELEQVGEAVVGHRAGAADGLELVIGLDQPQRDDLVVHRVELDAGRRRGQCRPVGVGQHLGLHAEGHDLEALEDRRQVLADSAGREDDLPPGCLALRLLGVARIGQQQLRVAGDEQRPGPGRLLLRHEPEAAEVALVRDPADQHPIELALVEDRCGGARRAHRSRRRSSS